MPTYEYRCGSCGHHFEKFSPRISDVSSIDCPKCDGKADRLISGGAGLLFRGSGFYTTDYRSDSYKEAAKKESKAPEAPSGKGASGDKKKESKKDKKK